MLHTLRQVRLGRSPTDPKTPVIFGITDDNLEWRVALHDVQPDWWSMDVAAALETLYAVACRRDPDLVAQHGPAREVPEAERQYLD